MEYISYLMGAEQITDGELQVTGAVIVGKTDGGSRKLRIPADSISAYEVLIGGRQNTPLQLSQKLERG